MITRLSGSPNRMALAVAALAVAASACTTSVPGTPLAQGQHQASDPKAPPEDLPPLEKSDEPKAAQFAAIRQIDPCALHDVQAASQVTGMGGDALMPDESLNVCQLEMSPGPNDLSAWVLRASVDRAGKPAPGQRRSAPEQLGDITAVKQVRQGDDEARNCDYVVALNDSSAAVSAPAGKDGAAENGVEITLSVRRQGLDAQPQSACQIAQGYLRAAGKYWKSPALRADQVTAPQIDLARVNPCSGLNALSEQMGGPIQAQLPRPYECEVRRALGAGAPTAGQPNPGTVSVKYIMDTDPRLSQSAAPSAPFELQQVTVAGQPGLVTKPKATAANPGTDPKALTVDRCTVSVIAHDKVGAKPDPKVDEKLGIQERARKADAPRSFGVIEAKAQTCELAFKAVEAARPGARPAAVPQVTGDKQQRLVGRTSESIKLGDLNPPPNATQVGAPFDPCALGWTAVPAEVRDPNNSAPERQWPGKDDKVDVICRYDHSGDITVSLDGAPPSGPEGGYMWAEVVWQNEPGGDVAGKKNPDGTPVAETTWPTGKKGYVQDLGTHAKFGAQCRAAVKLAQGVGAAYVSNSRFRNVKACDIATSIAHAIATTSQ